MDEEWEGRGGGAAAGEGAHWVEEVWEVLVVREGGTGV